MLIQELDLATEPHPSEVPEGETRVKYIEALRNADQGDMNALTALILVELTPL